MSVVRLIKQVKHIVITSHQNSDVDAVLSCCITKKLINSINPHVVVDVIVPRINVTAKKVLERLGLSNVIEEGDRFPEYDTCFFIDVNNPSHLGPLQKEVRIDKPVVIIDHHKPSSAIPPNTLISIIDEQAIATAEVLCDLMCELGIKPNKKEALCLLIGILYDSRKLSIGGLKTFHKVSFLLSCGASLAEASSILYMPLSYSEKIARLKASQRACLLSIGQWVVALSNVGSYEASAARALIDLGADIAAVCNEFEGGSRMCVRASEEFVRLTGIHLGKELEDLGLAMSGSGGGHASAACMSTPRTCNEVLKRFLELLSDRLKLPIKKVD